MNHCLPKNWFEIADDAVEMALKTLDHRQDGLGYYYERWNNKRFLIKSDGKWIGSPEYFKP